MSEMDGTKLEWAVRSLFLTLIFHLESWHWKRKGEREKANIPRHTVTVLDLLLSIDAFSLS